MGLRSIGLISAGAAAADLGCALCFAPSTAAGWASLLADLDAPSDAMTGCACAVAPFCLSCVSSVLMRCSITSNFFSNASLFDGSPGVGGVRAAYSPASDAPAPALRIDTDVSKTVRARRRRESRAQE